MGLGESSITVTSIRLSARMFTNASNSCFGFFREILLVTL